MAANMETITAERARQIIEMNRKGEKPESLEADGQNKAPQGPVDLATQENIARFDRAKKKKKKKKPSGAKTQEAKSKVQEPKVKNQEPRTKNQEPKAKS
jgi:hypothetical protein